MEADLRCMLTQLEQLSVDVEKRKQEILRSTHAEFIKAFVALNQALHALQDTQDTLEPRADWMVHNERNTIRKLRKEQFRVL
jgi:hypothetical protein